MDNQIKDRVSFDKMEVVLLLNNNTVFANNVVAIDAHNNVVWKINDIIKAENPCGNSSIKKIDDTTLRVISTVGMLYEIDVEKMIIKKSITVR